MSILYTPPKRIYLRKSSQDDKNEQMLAAILAFLEANEPYAVKQLRQLWKRQRGALSLSEIKSQLNHGTFLSDWYSEWHLEYQEFIDRVMVDSLLDAMRNAARHQLAGHPAFSFDTSSQEVIDWLNGQSLSLADTLTRTQVNGMTRAIEGSQKLDYAVSDLADVIQRMVGLTPRQALAVERYYDTLRTEGLSADAALSRTQRYINKSLNGRALNISRTELSNAFNEGSAQAIVQAQAMGLVGLVEKTWVTQHDERVCDTCGPLDGVTVQQNAMFPGGFVHPGAHVNCRCVLVYKEVKSAV